MDNMIVPFTAVPNILVRERFLSSCEKLVLFYIASMGPTGLTMSTKALRERLAPLGNTGLLRAIKRLQFLGMIQIEQVPKKQGEPRYKKPCHRYFFVKDPLEWRHTVDFRMKLKIEMERMEKKSIRVEFKNEVYADEKHLNDAFAAWLVSIKPAAYHQKPKTTSTSISEDAKKWISRIENLKSGKTGFLRIADSALTYMAELENEPEAASVSREKLLYMNMIFDAYEEAIQNPKDDQMEKDLEWIGSMKQQGLSAVKIALELYKEDRRRSVSIKVRKFLIAFT